MSITILQLQASLSLITDLQLRTENPTQYETYENHKKKLQEMISQQSAHSQSLGFKDAFGPASRLPSVVLDAGPAGAPSWSC